MAYAEPPPGTHYYKQDNSTNGDFQNLDEQSDLPEYPGSTELSAESVIAMAQTVGVTLSEDIAGALGELTIRKLRYATLLAMEFSDHANSSGLTVSDFSKAEQMLNLPSYGHESSLPPSALKPIGLARVSVLDEGPEIDLLASASSSKVSEIIVEDLDPTFFVNCPYDNGNVTEFEESLENRGPDGGRTDSSLDLTEVPLLDLEKESLSDDETNDSQNENELMPNHENALVVFNHNPVDHTNTMDEEDDEPRYEIRISTNCLENSFENHLDEIVENSPADLDYADEELKAEVKDILEELQCEGLDFTNNEQEVQQRYLTLDREWVEYIKVFVSCFLNDSPYEHDPCKFEMTSDDYEDVAHDMREEEEEDDFDNNSFQRILKDLQKYGAYPVLDVICDLFRDYIRGLIIPVSVIGLKRIFSVIRAFLICPSAPSLPQMRILSSLLIEIIILPPPCEVQHYLIQVFMQILRRYDELLTWACTYITEVLKKTIEMPANDLSEVYKSVIHGALCLSNGLETLKIQVAQEFGWHTSIVNFIRRHSESFDGVNNSVADGYIQEQILIFCRNFLLNYKRLVSSKEMQRIHNSMKDVFGEKMIPYLCRKENFISRNRRSTMQVKHSTFTLGSQNIASPNNSSYIIRKGYYKNKKVRIPYKSLLSSGLL